MARAAGPRRRGGFTLIEILVAIALLLALSAALGGVLFGLSERRELVAIEAARQGSIDILFSELDSALVGTSVEAATSTGRVAGLKGDATSLIVIFRGVRLAPGSGAGDLVGLEVRAGSSGSIMARRLDLASGSAGTLEAAATDIARVRFRYFDGKAWRDQFDSLATGRLPVAVECSVWFAGNEPEADALAGPEAEGRVDSGLDSSEGDEAGELDGDARVDGESGDDVWPRPSRRRLMIVPDGEAAPASSSEGER